MSIIALDIASSIQRKFKIAVCNDAFTPAKL